MVVTPDEVIDLVAARLSNYAKREQLTPTYRVTISPFARSCRTVTLLRVPQSAVSRAAQPAVSGAPYDSAES